MPNANVDDSIVESSEAGPLFQQRGDENTLSVYGPFGLLTTTTFDGHSIHYSYSDSNTSVQVAPFPGLMIGATDDFGRNLTFVRNSAAQLAQLIDPAGNVYTYQYGITTLSPLSVQYPDGSIKQYSWGESTYTGGTSQPGALTGITEVWPDGTTVRAGTYAYDRTGLAISTQRAAGLDLFTTQNSGAQVIVTDPLGTQRTTSYSTLFETAYPTVRGQPGGSGCAASTSLLAYDANGNTASRDDFDGNRVCYVSDPVRNLEGARVEGLSNSVACSGVTGTGAALPNGSRKISTQWHPNWRIPISRAEPRKLTTWVYNGQPDPFKGNAIASCAPAVAQLPDGKPIATLCKTVEQVTADTDGHLGFSAALQSSAARVKQWTYNQFGQVLTESGPRTDLNDTVTYTYYSDTTSTHTTGDLSQVTNALGQVVQLTKYDPHGNVLESIDANGVVTDNVYDVRQRLTSTTVGGLQTTFAYDPAGDLRKATLPDTTVVNYSYDQAHRLVGVADQAGNSITYTLDNAGNRLQDQVKDPSGTLARTVTRAYDTLGRASYVIGAVH